MVLIIIIAFFSLISLIIIHELGHFLLAKRFGVKVEEFGIGYPPRLFGKKIGETIYSINLLPFGAFVKIYGQEKRIEDPRSFTTKPFWQKVLIIVAGVISFWIVAAILLSIVMGIGVPTIIQDEENQGLVDPKIQITAIASNSPAEKAGLKPGDTIMGISGTDINKVKEVQGFTQAHKGEEIILTIRRGKEVFDVSLVPRVSPPENEGAMGVALARTALKSYPWYQAPIKGIVATGNLTLMIIKVWGTTIMNLFQGKGVPAGVEVKGIVGIFGLFIQVGAMGVSYFLQFIAMISVSLALINILPIPALDGGWLLFLVIEKLK
ncbi:unnamed protein product, partial [marine sediment metagenome]